MAPKQQIYATLRRLADGPRSVVVISSELIELVGLCDRVLAPMFHRFAG